MPLLKLSASCKGNPHPQLMLFTPEDTLLCAFTISLALQSWLQRNGRSRVDLLEEYTQKYNDISFKNQSKCVLFIYLIIITIKFTEGIGGNLSFNMSRV